jgi:hypothetical protein
VRTLNLSKKPAPGNPSLIDAAAKPRSHGKRVKFIRDLLHLLRWAGAPAFLALAVSGVIDQFLNQRLELLLMSDEGPGATIWMLASASLLNSLLFPVFVGFCFLYALSQQQGSREILPNFLARTLNQLYIETLRAWGSVLRWGLFLILPGVVRAVQLAYVPYVVAFHRPFDEGQSDALQTSGRYVGRHPFRLLAILISFSIIIPLILTDALDNWRSYESSPLTALLCTFLDLLVFAVSTLLIFRLFERTRKELGDESVFQLEGHPQPEQGPNV